MLYFTYDSPLGFLAFGGIAPVPVTRASATVPIQDYFPGFGQPGLYYYYIDIDSYIFPGSEGLNTSGAVMLDTGTTVNYVPTDIAKAYNAHFSPPAKFVDDEDTYYVDCNATAPPFSANIGGKLFAIDPRDQIIPQLDANNNVVCISGTQDGGPDVVGNVYVL